MAINPYEQLQQANWGGKPLTSQTQGGTGSSQRVGGPVVKGQESTVNAPAPTEGRIVEAKAKVSQNNAQANVEPGNNPTKPTDTRSGRRGMFDWMKPKAESGGGGGGNTYGDIMINTGSGIAGKDNKQIQGDGQIDGEKNELTISGRRRTRPAAAPDGDMAPTPPGGTTAPGGDTAPDISGGTPPRIKGTPGKPAGTPRPTLRTGAGTPRPTLRTGAGSAAPRGSDSPRPRLRTGAGVKELGTGVKEVGTGVKELGPGPAAIGSGSSGMLGGGDSTQKKQNFQNLQSAAQSSLKNKVDTKPQPSNAPNSNSAETKTAVSGITAGMQAGQAAQAAQSSGPKNTSQPTKNGAPQQVADKEKAKKDAKGKVKAAVKSGPKNVSAKKTGSKKPAMKADERIKAKPRKTSK